MLKKIIKKDGKEAAKTVIFILKRFTKKLLKRQAYVTIAVPGGNSVKPVFKLLKDEDLPWEKIHLFMVDERMVPITNKNSNFKLTNVFNKNLPKENIHPFHLKEGINSYKNELKKFKGKFDIVLLSAGEDGHIGALFPHHETIQNGNEFFITTNSSPKPPKNRMTSSKNLILRSSIGIILFLTESKRDALNNFNNDKLNIKDCPAKLVKQLRNTYLITDLK